MSSRVSSAAPRHPHRHAFPAPPEPPRETRLQRYRRKARTKTLRLFEAVIVGLYHTIARLERLAPVERRYFRVALFGSSRIQDGDHGYDQVRELARQLSFLGCDIVTGGGPGLMRAANEGARRGAYRHKTRSFGLTILLPLEEQPNPFLDEVAEHRTFFSRLHQFIRLSHAYVVMDGGIGTTLEAMMVWQLIQVQLLKDRPLIFLGPMWSGLRGWVEEEIIDRGLASPGDTRIVHWVERAEDAVAIVRDARNRFLERHEVLLPPPAEADDPEASATGPTPAAGDPAR
jgi:hypothetical protein